MTTVVVICIFIQVHIVCFVPNVHTQVDYLGGRNSYLQDLPCHLYCGLLYMTEEIHIPMHVHIKLCAHVASSPGFHG